MSTPKKQQIVLFASELAALVGENPYQPLKKSWAKQCQKLCGDPADANLKEADIFVDLKNDLLPVKSDREIIDQITTTYDIRLPAPSFQEKVASVNDGAAETSETKRGATVEELNNDTASQLAAVDGCAALAQNPELKQVLEKAVRSQLQKDFGTQEESSVAKQAEVVLNTTIEKSDRFVKRKLFETERFAWFLGGRVDGVTQDGEVVEIKNRVCRLFYEVRRYELIQMLAYLFIHQKSAGYLVEGFKRGGDQRQIQLDFELIYFCDHEHDWECNIKAKLVSICTMFDHSGALQNPLLFLESLSL